MTIELGSIVDRLLTLDLFTTVSDVVDFAEVLNTGLRPPAAFVATGRETASANRTQGVHDQAVDVDVAIMFALAAQRADGRRNDAAEETRFAVIGALAGFTPAGASKALDYTGFRIMRIDQGLIWGECSFRTGWRLRQPPSFA